MRSGSLAAILSAFAMAAAGCAHTPQMGVRKTSPPVPAPLAGTARTDEVIEGAGRVELYARAYRPETGDVRGVVVIMNGLKDHGDHYAPFSELLVRRGYATYAFDMRGHGRSAGERATVDRFDDYLDDLQKFVELVRAREPKKPIFVFGHSLGGAIVTLYAIERRPEIAGVILSGPALAVDGPAVQAAAVPFIDDVAPRAPVFELPNEDFSRDPAIVADMARDPLVFQEKAPAHTAAEIFVAMRRIWAQPEQLTVPLLALHGTADKLTAPSGSRDLVARAGGRDKTLRLYEGFYHDLVHEPGHERVTSDVAAWLDARAGGDPSSTPRSDYDASPAAPRLLGDRISASTGVEIDARGERFAFRDQDHLALTGGLRVRQAFGRIGWLGGLDLRAGSEQGFRWQADLHALGVGARFGTWQLGATGGIGAVGIDGTTLVRIPSEVIIEGGLGPVRLLSRGGIAWRLNEGGPGTFVLGIADEASALLGVRLGGDRRYWADVRAGQGPFLGATYARRGEADLWGIVLGIHLWGAN